MTGSRRPPAFWVVVGFLVVSIFLMVIGQTMAVFNYELTVRLGLQESFEQVGGYGVQVNRAVGAGDTLVYIPLMIVSLVGLVLRKRWSLLSMAAFFGVSAYWSLTIWCMLIFLRGAPGFAYDPGPEIWLFLGTYAVTGVVGLFYLVFRGDELVR